MTQFRIAEEHRRPSPTARHAAPGAGRSRGHLRVAVVLAAACALPIQAAGPDQTRAAPDVQITVRDVSADDRLIKVAVNRSVLVDFNVPLKEVRLANPEIAEVSVTSPKQLVVTGKSYGTTQLIVWIDEDNQKIFNVAVDLDLERLALTIRSTVPRAKVKVSAVLDRVLLGGTAPDADAAQRIMELAEIYSEKVVNQMRVAGVQQVLLRVTVAEVNRSAIRQLGFNGWIAGDNLHDFFGVNQLDGINPVNIGGAGNFGPIGGAQAAAIPFLTGSEGLPLRTSPALSFGFPRVQMQIFIKALRENGLLRVLAEPNLVSISGQEATFLAGGEIPIPIVTDERIKIEYKEFGIRLTFTPTVISEDVIRLKVAPEISEADFTNALTIGGFTIPAFTARRVETTVELGSGQTFAIGGLLSERSRGISRKIPGLGDIPILGPLFSSVEYQSNRTEFVVLVTPELVEGISPHQITSVPGANMLAPNDFELFLEGKLEGAEGPPGLQPRVNHTWPVRPDELYGSSAVMKVRGPVGPAGMEEGS